MKKKLFEELLESVRQMGKILRGEMKPLGWKVIKGLSKKSAILDSTHPDFSKAHDRATTLRAGLRGSRTKVRVVPAEPGDPKKFRKTHRERVH